MYIHGLLFLIRICLSLHLTFSKPWCAGRIRPPPHTHTHTEDDECWPSVQQLPLTHGPTLWQLNHHACFRHRQVLRCTVTKHRHSSPCTQSLGLLPSHRETCRGIKRCRRLLCAQCAWSERMTTWWMSCYEPVRPRRWTPARVFEWTSQWATTWMSFAHNFLAAERLCVRRCAVTAPNGNHASLCSSLWWEPRLHCCQLPSKERRYWLCQKSLSDVSCRSCSCRDVWVSWTTKSKI